MIRGDPPQPTLRHMIAGIALAVVLLLAFLNIPIVVKYGGTALTFIPSKLGLIKVVSKSEVMPVDFNSNPISVTFTKPGMYLLYTDDYSLLTLNDGVVASNGKPWLKLQSEFGESIQVTLIGRGMAIYDTPLARGRPVVSFEITQSGEYTLTHPVRPIDIYIVPDYISGREGTITFYIFLQFLVIALVIWTIIQKNRARAKQHVQPGKRSDIHNHSISGRT